MYAPDIYTSNKMDQLLSKASTTLVTFAVRSGVQIASTYVVKSVSMLMDSVPEHEKKKIDRKRNQLQDKIEIVTYSIEVVQLMAARGNSNLSNVLRLGDYLKEDIEEFTSDISKWINDSKNNKLTLDTIKLIEKTIDVLIAKIDNLIPILNLVLTTYGASAVNNFQDYVSPGRLLNSTVLVNNSNEAFLKMNQKEETQVGPDFFLTFYNIFYNHSSMNNESSPIIWREKYARCKLQIYRVVNKSFMYSYEVRILEDFNDERYHDEDDKEDSKAYDIRQIKKLFFSASGRLLKLEDRSSPVLVLKMKKATKEKLDIDTLGDGDGEGGSDAGSDDSQYEWVALGDYEGADDDDESDKNDDENDDEDENENEDDVSDANIKLSVDKVKLKPLTAEGSPLSLLEYLIRLCTLQANDQISLFDVKDERLRLYLADENYMNKVSNQISSLSKKMNELKL